MASAPAAKAQPWRSAAIPKATVLALARRGTRVVVLGKTKDLGKYLVPTATTSDDPPLPHGTRRDALVDSILGLAPNEGAVRAEVVTTYLWPWSDIDRSDLDRRAERLSTELSRRAPDRRYVVVPRYVPGDVERTLFVRRVSSGTLEVRRALESLGLKVNRLIRVSYGQFELGELEVGALEEVDPADLLAEVGQFISEKRRPAPFARREVQRGKPQHAKQHKPGKAPPSDAERRKGLDSFVDKRRDDRKTPGGRKDHSGKRHTGKPVREKGPRGPRGPR